MDFYQSDLRKDFSLYGSYRKFDKFYGALLSDHSTQSMIVDYLEMKMLLYSYFVMTRYDIADFIDRFVCSLRSFNLYHGCYRDCKLELQNKVDCWLQIVLLQVTSDILVHNNFFDCLRFESSHFEF